MKSLKFYLVTLAVLTCLYLLAQFNRPKEIDWRPSFSSEDKIPFGTYIVFNRINDIFPKAKVTSFREPIYNVLNDYEITHGTYLIISNSIGLNKYDYQKLLKFIQNGSDVFMSASDFGPELFKRLKIKASEENKDMNSDTAPRFTNKYLDTNKRYNIGKSAAVGFFSNFDTTNMIVLGVNSLGDANFLKYHTGKGNLYLNSMPLMFTNYSLINKNGCNYAAKALSYLRNDPNLIWDQYYALGREDQGSPMRVFLRNDSLRWSFYIAFFSLIAFVLFEVKRRQRIIPIIEPLENTTLSFVNVVGQVYYERHDNKNICEKKVLYFLEQVRIKFNLKTNPLNEEFTINLSQKTGIEPEFISQLVNHINLLSSQETLSNKKLIELNNLIEQFYTKSR